MILSCRASQKIKPLALMRLVQIKNPDDLLKNFKKNDIIVEQKIDGIKVQIIKDNDLKIYTRKGKEITKNFPDLVNNLKNIPNGTFIEGELVYIKKGKQDLGKIVGLSNSTKENALKKQKELSGDIKVFLYDILFKEWKLVAKFPFFKRRKILETVIKPYFNISLTKQYPFEKWKYAIKEALKAGGEGIVLKFKNAPYKYKKLGQLEPKPAGIMWKFKGHGGKETSDDFILYDYELGEKGKFKIKFGQFYKNKFYGISEISNISKEQENEIKNKIKKGPIVAEIGFQEKVPGGLRHQKLKRLRDDKNLKDCIMSDIHIENINNFKSIKINF